MAQLSSEVSTDYNVVPRRTLTLVLDSWMVDECLARRERLQGGGNLRAAHGALGIVQCF